MKDTSSLIAFDAWKYTILGYLICAVLPLLSLHTASNDPQIRSMETYASVIVPGVIFLWWFLGFCLHAKGCRNYYKLNRTGEQKFMYTILPPLIGFMGTVVLYMFPFILVLLSIFLIFLILSSIPSPDPDKKMIDPEQFGEEIPWPPSLDPIQEEQDYDTK